MIPLPSLAILLYTLYTPTTSGHTLPRQAASPPPPPGANPETMGGQSAQAMNIGTGGSQQDKYSSSYSTPNYTQYTKSDYKDFMPDYKSMMSMNSMTKQENGSANNSASSSNFMDIGAMMKTFLELQKQQAELDKNKTAEKEPERPPKTDKPYEEDPATNLSLRKSAQWPGQHGNISIAIPNIPTKGFGPMIGLGGKSKEAIKPQPSDEDDDHKPWDSHIINVMEMLTTSKEPEKDIVSPIKAMIPQTLNIQDQNTLKDFLSALISPSLSKISSKPIPVVTTLERLLSRLVTLLHYTLPDQRVLPLILWNLEGDEMDLENNLIQRDESGDGRVNVTFVIIRGDNVTVINKEISLDDERQASKNQRKIEIELKQDQQPVMPGGAAITEELSGGGGIEYGKHEGGGVSLKLNIDSQEISKEKTSNADLDRDKRQDMMNLFFTW